MPPDNNNQFLLGAMDAKLDTLVLRSGEDRAEVKLLTKRVEVLEAWRWKILGGAAVLGFIAGMICKVLFHD